MSTTSPQPVEPDVRPTRTTANLLHLMVALALIAIMVVLVATLLTAGGPRPQQLAAAGASGAASADPSDKPDGDRKANVEGRAGNFSRDITVTAINGNRVSLRTADGWERTITVTSAMTIRKGGADVTVSALEVGDEVRLRQQRDDAGVYTVTAIVVPTPVTGGTVTATDADSIDLKRRNGETQVVLVTSATTYTVGKTAGTKADVVVGARVAIEGTVEGATFTAGAVHVSLEKISGEVTAKSGSTITLTHKNGTTTTVHVDGDTTYRVRGVDGAAALADIAVGARASARGTLRADGSIDANQVEARKPKPKPKPTPTPGG